MLVCLRRSRAAVTARAVESVEEVREVGKAMVALEVEVEVEVVVVVPGVLVEVDLEEEPVEVNMAKW